MMYLTNIIITHWVRVEYAQLIQWERVENIIHGVLLPTQFCQSWDTACGVVK